MSSENVTAVRLAYARDVLARADDLGLSRRARKVLEMLIETEDEVTTLEMQAVGLGDPASAIRDLKDKGIRMTKRTLTVEGRRTASYWILTAEEAGSSDRLEGRTAIPVAFRRELFEAWDSQCAICLTKFPTRLLQPDHRVPFRVAGEVDAFRVEDFMPLCGSHNRQKSFECERCPNYEVGDLAVCNSCYWASPEGYEHVATLPQRNVSITFRSEVEVALFNEMGVLADEADLSLPDWIKRSVREQIAEE